MQTDRPNCYCKPHSPTRFIVLTGGPGAGKTALLEGIRRSFCEHVMVLPEAASILYCGGFPRVSTADGIRAAQRAIFAVQHELESAVAAQAKASIVLCDRGTLDGAAYWPGGLLDFCRENRTDPSIEFRRYSSVVHLRTPAEGGGYDLSNPARNETPERAKQLDELLLKAWAGHPRRTVIDATTDFEEKVMQALELIQSEVPICCFSAEK